jgi:phage terminase large subunit-like protein
MTLSTKKSRDYKVRLASLLLEKKTRMSEDPLRYAARHPKQEEAYQEMQKKVLVALFWGNRVGKTELGAQIVSEVAQGKHPVIPPGEIWSFCPSFDEQKGTTQKKLLKYLPENKIIDRIWLRKGILREIVVDAGNGRKSLITFKSYEQGREKAQGAGKVLIWFDEEPPKDLFEECFVRQDAGVLLKILMTMTPIKGMTWVYSEIYLKTDNPDYFISSATWEDNPWLLKVQTDVMSRGLSKESLEVRKKGKFMRRVGLVCTWFQRSVHVIDMPEIPDGTTIFGNDFGFSNPDCGLWVRVDYDNNLWIFDGFYRTELTTPKLAAIIRTKEQGLGLVKRIADSAQASDIKQLNDEGIKIVGIKKESGTNKENWDEYRARLLQQWGAVQPGTGKPKIFISSKLTAIDEKTGEKYNFLLKELEGLMWDEVKSTEGISQKPVWGPQPKHAIDTLSYILVWIFGTAKEEQQENSSTTAGWVSKRWRKNS